MADKWTTRGLEMARYFSTWSKDPAKQVGAALVSPDRRVIVPGYNGLPIGIDDTDTRLNDREYKLKHTVHAEANALLNATVRPVGYTLFVWPLPPCTQCAAMIIQAGVARVVAPPPRECSKWREICEKGRELLEEAGVEVVWLET